MSSSNGNNDEPSPSRVENKPFLIPFESVRFYDSNRHEINSYKEIYDNTQTQTFLIKTNPYSKPIQLPYIIDVFERQYGNTTGIDDYVNFLLRTPYYDTSHSNYGKEPDPSGSIYYDPYDSMSGITPDAISDLIEWAKKPPINKAVFFGWNRTLTLVQRHLSYEFIKEVVKKELQKKINERTRTKKLEDTRTLKGFETMLDENLNRILNSMMIYLFGGEARLQMIRDMFTMLSENHVHIFIITHDKICPIDFIKLLTDKVPESNIKCTGGVNTKATFLGKQDPRLIHKKTKTIGNSIKGFFGYGGAGGKRTQTQKRKYNRKYNRKQKTQKRKNRK